jgi:hypothetical protein
MAPERIGSRTQYHALKFRAGRPNVHEFHPEGIFAGGRHLIDQDHRSSNFSGEIFRSRGSIHLCCRGPIFGRLVGGVGIALGQGHAGSVGRLGPATVITIAEFIHQAIALVDESQPFASILKAACEGPELTRPRRLGHHQVGTWINERPCWKGVANPLDSPAGEIGKDAHLVEQLDPLPVFRLTDRIVVDFIEDHHRIRRSVSHTPCRHHAKRSRQGSHPESVH